MVSARKIGPVESGLTVAENLNEQLLLTIQSVCNMSSVKIPWDKVAKTMGETVSEGAIVQHLAKLRSRRVDAGKTVPPPLRRGGGSASKPSKPAQEKATSPTPVSKRKTRTHTIKKEPESEEESEQVVVPVDSDSGSEYGKKARPKKAKRSLARRHKAQISSSNGIENSEESDTEQDEASTDDEHSGELLASGARFLEYPNVSQSDLITPMEQSKIVVLKYRPRENSNLHVPHSASVELASSYAESADWLPSMTYGIPSQLGFMGSNVNSFEDYRSSSFVASRQDMLDHDPPAAVSSFGGFSHDAGSELAGTYPFNSFQDLLSSSTYPVYEDSSCSNAGNPSEIADGDMSSMGLKFPQAPGGAFSGSYLSFKTPDGVYR